MSGCSCASTCASTCAQRTGVTPSFLGFLGKYCPTCPCPPSTVVHVKVCVRINKATKLTRETGCLVSQTDEGCTVNYTFPVSQTTDGRTCTTVVFDRLMPANQFLRLRLCSAQPLDCSTGCGDDVIDACGTTVTNAIISYTLDGVDILPSLQKVLTDDSGVKNCVRVGCIDASLTETCCHDAEGVPTFTSLSDMPFGSQVIVGPVGQGLAIFQ
jgi:hypothetical protein